MTAMGTPRSRTATAGGRGFGGFDFSATGFADIFDEMFGEFMGARARRPGPRPRRRSPLQHEITLQEAFAGKQTTIRVPRLGVLRSLPGNRRREGHPAGGLLDLPRRRPGAGQQGFFTIERTCHACGGAGKVIEKPCKGCNGAGRVRKEKTLAVNVPAGVEDGTRIRLAGEGEIGMRGAPPGDLYIFLSVTPASAVPARGRHICSAACRYR